MIRMIRSSIGLHTRPADRPTSRSASSLIAPCGAGATARPETATSVQATLPAWPLAGNRVAWTAEAA